MAFFGAVQAQEYPEAKWSLGQRLRGWTEADVETACDRGEILRTHVLRPTWHFVAAEDLRWIQRLTAPRVKAFNRYYDRRAGLDESLLGRAFEAIARALEPGEPMTRRELGDVLEDAGIEARGQRLAHLVMHAELDCLICSGPRRGKQHTYALVDQRAPAAPQRSREKDLLELTLRYFRSHGPATVKDFAWWSSLKVADIKAALAAAGDRLAVEADDSGTPWYSAPDAEGKASTAGAYLLGSYDESVIAYKDFRVVLAEQPPGPGLLIRPIVIGGRVVGTWKSIPGQGHVTLEATVFTRLSQAGQRALEREARRFGRFFGLPVSLETVPAA